MKKKCYHTVVIPIPDWEAAEKVTAYRPGAQYVRCVKCKKIMEEDAQ